MVARDGEMRWGGEYKGKVSGVYRQGEFCHAIGPRSIRSHMSIGLLTAFDGSTA